MELSIGQQALWFLYRLAPESTAYLITVALRVYDVLDLDRLRGATAAVMARHELLRSVFDEVDGVPRRSPADLPPPLTVVDLGPVDEDALRAGAARAAGQPFDLGEGAFRVTLVRGGAGDAVLLVTAHHIVSDAMSQWMILRDLLWAYEQDEPGWPVITRTFDDYVRHERESLESPRRGRLERYWRGVCEGAEPAGLPADRTRSAGSFRGAAVTLVWPESTGARLIDQARKLGVTPFAVVVAALQAALHRRGASGDFLIGCPVSTRFAARTRDVVGCFANTVPLRARLTPGITLGEAAVAAHRELVAATAHGEFPSALIRELSPGRGLPYHLAVNLLSMDAMDPPLPLAADGSIEGPPTTYRGMRIAVLDLAQMEGQFDLMVDVRRAGTLFTAVVKYDADLFDQLTIERFTSRLRQVVESGPDAPIGRVPRVDESEVARLLAFGEA
ncbi:condensation domain-containing protein [Nonomuraea sp. SBT364]|uniref:condensation domain-containing protein n=1 Tax=Nonomuraea sp. SBT364 TaxID=1580530 RepID=UPI00066A8D3A|nr:condensation domain-containing protein [Nonomuraea sp. SBT364]